MSQTITIYNLGGLPTAPLDAFNDLQENFKISDDAPYNVDYEGELYRDEKLIPYTDICHGDR